MSRISALPVKPASQPRLEELDPYFQAAPQRAVVIGKSSALDQMYEYYTQL